MVEKLKITEAEKVALLKDMEILNKNAEEIQQENFDLKKENKLLLNKILNKE